MAPSTRNRNNVTEQQANNEQSSIISVLKPKTKKSTQRKKTVRFDLYPAVIPNKSDLTSKSSTDLLYSRSLDTPTGHYHRKRRLPHLTKSSTSAVSTIFGLRNFQRLFGKRRSLDIRYEHGTGKNMQHGSQVSTDRQIEFSPLHVLRLTGSNICLYSSSRPEFELEENLELEWECDKLTQSVAYLNISPSFAPYSSRLQLPQDQGEIELTDTKNQSSFAELSCEQLLSNTPNELIFSDSSSQYFNSNNSASGKLESDEAPETEPLGTENSSSVTESDSESTSTGIIISPSIEDIFPRELLFGSIDFRGITQREPISPESSDMNVNAVTGENRTHRAEPAVRRKGPYTSNIDTVNSATIIENVLPSTVPQQQNTMRSDIIRENMLPSTVSQQNAVSSDTQTENSLPPVLPQQKDTSGSAVCDVNDNNRLEKERICVKMEYSHSGSETFNSSKQPVFGESGLIKVETPSMSNVTSFSDSSATPGTSGARNTPMGQQDRNSIVAMSIGACNANRDCAKTCMQSATSSQSQNEASTSNQFVEETQSEIKEERNEFSSGAETGSHSTQKPSPSEILYHCPILGCSQSFSEQIRLTSHLASLDHSPCNPLVSLVDACLPEPTNFQCPACSMRFQTEASCEEHQFRSRHSQLLSPVASSVWACPQCFLLFPLLSAALQHMDNSAHHTALGNFEDDAENINSAPPVLVPSRLVKELVSRCSNVKFALFCQSCRQPVFEPSTLASHLNKRHIVSAKCCTTVADVFSTLLTDDACAECHQYIFSNNVPFSGLAVHTECPLQGPILTDRARSLKEFVLRCGISGLDLITEEAESFLACGLNLSQSTIYADQNSDSFYGGETSNLSLSCSDIQSERSISGSKNNRAESIQTLESPTSASSTETTNSTCTLNGFVVQREISLTDIADITERNSQDADVEQQQQQSVESMSTEDLSVGISGSKPFSEPLPESSGPSGRAIPNCGSTSELGESKTLSNKIVENRCAEETPEQTVGKSASYQSSHGANTESEGSFNSISAENSEDKMFSIPDPGVYHGPAYLVMANPGAVLPRQMNNSAGLCVNPIMFPAPVSTATTAIQTSSNSNSSASLPAVSLSGALSGSTPSQAMSAENMLPSQNKSFTGTQPQPKQGPVFSGGQYSRFNLKCFFPQVTPTAQSLSQINKTFSCALTTAPGSSGLTTPAQVTEKNGESSSTFGGNGLRKRKSSSNIIVSNKLAKHQSLGDSTVICISDSDASATEENELIPLRRGESAKAQGSKLGQTSRSESMCIEKTGPVQPEQHKTKTRGSSAVDVPTASEPMELGSESETSSVFETCTVFHPSTSRDLANISTFLVQSQRLIRPNVISSQLNGRPSVNANIGTANVFVPPCQPRILNGPPLQFGSPHSSAFSRGITDRSTTVSSTYDVSQMSSSASVKSGSSSAVDPDFSLSALMRRLRDRCSVVTRNRTEDKIDLTDFSTESSSFVSDANSNVDIIEISDGEDSFVIYNETQGQRPRQHSFSVIDVSSEGDDDDDLEESVFFVADDPPVTRAGTKRTSNTASSKCKQSGKKNQTSGRGVKKGKATQKAKRSRTIKNTFQKKNPYKASDRFVVTTLPDQASLPCDMFPAGNPTTEENVDISKKDLYTTSIGQIGEQNVSSAAAATSTTVPSAITPITSEDNPIILSGEENEVDEMEEEDIRYIVTRTRTIKTNASRPGNKRIGATAQKESKPKPPVVYVTGVAKARREDTISSSARDTDMVEIRPGDRFIAVSRADSTVPASRGTDVAEVRPLDRFIPVSGSTVVASVSRSTDVAEIRPGDRFIPVSSVAGVSKRPNITEMQTGDINCDSPTTGGTNVAELGPGDGFKVANNAGSLSSATEDSSVEIRPRDRFIAVTAANDALPATGRTDVVETRPGVRFKVSGNTRGLLPTPKRNSSVGLRTWDRFNPIYDPLPPPDDRDLPIIRPGDRFRAIHAADSLLPMPPPPPPPLPPLDMDFPEIYPLDRYGSISCVDGLLPFPRFADDYDIHPWDRFISVSQWDRFYDFNRANDLIPIENRASFRTISDNYPFHREAWHGGADPDALFVYRQSPSVPAHIRGPSVQQTSRKNTPTVKERNSSSVDAVQANTQDGVSLKTRENGQEEAHTSKDNSNNRGAVQGSASEKSTQSSEWSPHSIPSMHLRLDGPKRYSPGSSKRRRRSSSSTVVPKSVNFNRLVSPQISHLATMKKIIFADLENFWVFGTFRGPWPDKAFLWGFVCGGRVNTPFNQETYFMKFPLYNWLKQKNRVHISTDIGPVKNACDFAMTLAIAKLDDRLPIHIPFYIVSRDKGFLEVESQLRDTKRRVKVVRPSTKLDETDLN